MAQSFHFCGERLWFSRRPGHPGQQVIEAFGDRIRKQDRICRIVTADDKTGGNDAVGRIEHEIIRNKFTLLLFNEAKFRPIAPDHMHSG